MATSFQDLIDKYNYAPFRIGDLKVGSLYLFLNPEDLSREALGVCRQAPCGPKVLYEYGAGAARPLPIADKTVFIYVCDASYASNFKFSRLNIGICIRSMKCPDGMWLTDWLAVRSDKAKWLVKYGIIRPQAVLENAHEEIIQKGYISSRSSFADVAKVYEKVFGHPDGKSDVVISRGSVRITQTNESSDEDAAERRAIHDTIKGA